MDGKKRKGEERSSSAPAAKVNPILVEEVTLNPEAVAKKRKPSGDKPAAKQFRAPTSGRRPLKKATGAGDTKGSAHAQSQDTSEGLRPLPPRVTRLTPQHLIAGMQVLAIVKEVQDLELRVSLPDGLSAVVSATDVSPELTDLFQRAAKDNTALPTLKEYFVVGTPVRGVMLEVSKTGKGTRTHLSLYPSKINTGITTDALAEGMSVEDHGYVVSFGLASLTGFVAKKNVNEGRTYLVGQPIETVILSPPTQSRSVLLAAKTSMVTRALTNETPGFSFDAIKVGALVKATVVKVVANGAYVGFLSVLHGGVPEFHLLPGAAPHKGQEFRARVIWVDYEKKMANLSARPAIVEYRTDELAISAKYGSLLEATVTRIDHTLGLSVAVNSDPPLPGYVHISRASDEEMTHFGDKYAPGTKHPCRVIGQNLLDGALVLSLKPSEVSGTFMTYDELRLGQKVKGTIASVTEKGIKVQLAQSVKGLVPLLHGGDMPLAFANVQKKFQVTHLDAEKRKLILTHKPTLLKTELPLITAFEEAQEGVVSHGWISAIRDNGLVVHFYGPVKGWVPKEELGLDTTGSNARPLSTLYRDGQVVKCRVLQCNATSERLLLSLNVTPSRQRLKRAELIASSAAIGSVISGVATGVDEHGVLVRIDNDTDKPLRGRIPYNQLSDHLALVTAIRTRLSQATEESPVPLPELLVLNHRGEDQSLVLSRKAALIDAARNQRCPASVADIVADTILMGYVTGVTAEHGVFVSFLADCTALAPLKLLVDALMTEPSKFYSVGQTVRVKVKAVSEDKKRVTVSLKASDTSEKDQLFLRTLAADREFLFGEKKDKISAFLVGAVVDGKVARAEKFGVVVSLSDGVTGFATAEQAKGAEQKVGATVRGLVLDADIENGIIDLTLQPEHTTESAPSAKKLLSQTTKALKKETDLSGVIQLVKENYLVIRLPSVSNGIVIAPCRDFNLTYLHVFSIYKVGQRVTINACELSPDGLHVFARLASGVSGGARTAFTGTVNSVEEVTPGQIVKCKIRAKKGMRMIVTLGYHVNGHIHASEVFDTPPEGTLCQAFDGFKEDDVIEAKVLGVIEEASKKQLAVTHATPTMHKVVELTVRPSEMERPDVLVLSRTYATLQPGKVVTCTVHQTSSDQLWVHTAPSVRGRIFALDVSNKPEEIEKMEEIFVPGTVLQAQVVHVNPEKRTVDLNRRVVLAGGASSLKDVKPGEILLGRVAKREQFELSVQLFSHAYGRVHITELTDTFRAHPLFYYSPGQIVRCCVVKRHGTRLDLSLRPSRTETNPPASPLPPIQSFTDVQDGVLVQGYVTALSEKGMFVALSRKVSGRVLLAELSDDRKQCLLKNAQERYKIGMLVTARVTAVDTGARRIELSLRRSTLFKQRMLTYSDIKVGMHLNGTIKRITDFGAFIVLDRTRGPLEGMCHKEEISDTPIAKIEDVYQAGDYVRCSVIKMTPEKNRISLSMKQSRFTEEERAQAAKAAAEDEGEDAAEAESDLTTDEISTLKKLLEEEDVPPPADSKASGVAVGDADENAEEVADGEKRPEMTEGDLDALVADGDEDEEVEGIEATEPVEAISAEASQAKKPKKEPPAALQIEPGFEWDDAPQPKKSKAEKGSKEKKEEKTQKRKGTDANGTIGKRARGEESDEQAKEEEDNESADEESEGEEKVSRSAKKSAKKRAEAEIRSKEEKLLRDAAPETDADFERLLMANPNSSLAYVRYIALQLSRGEVDKARKIAERALQKIGFRQEREKTNIWVSYLNLEQLSGTPETLAKVFERAVASSDAKQMHFHLLSIYQRSNNQEMMEQLLKTMTRKFKESSKVWLAYITAKLKAGNHEEARAVLQRSLKSLPKRKFVPVISKYAQLEFKYGSAERGRTIFEELLADNPKRVDLWSVYIDMELKAGTPDSIRHLFNRVTSMNFNLHKMKFFFRRYLAYEKAHGTTETIEAVKERATQFMDDKLESTSAAPAAAK